MSERDGRDNDELEDILGMQKGGFIQRYFPSKNSGQNQPVKATTATGTTTGTEASFLGNLAATVAASSAQLDQLHNAGQVNDTQYYAIKQWLLNMQALITRRYQSIQAK